MVVVRQVEHGSDALRVQLVSLLQNVVEDGASIGFVLPITDDIATAYWQDVFQQLDSGLAMWIATENDKVIGTVQFSACMKPNGMHRADVQKLMVHTDARGKGVSSKLLTALEAFAIEQRRWMLVLDTEADSSAAKIYQHWNWQRVGEIPEYAGLPSGELIPTCYYYKSLKDRIA